MDGMFKIIFMLDFVEYSHFILLTRCNHLGNELIILSNQIPLDEENHEMVEAAGKSLLAMQKLCKVKLQGNKELYQSLYTLETYYKKSFQNDVFFDELYQLTTELTNTYDPVLE